MTVVVLSDAMHKPSITYRLIIHDTLSNWASLPAMVLVAGKPCIAGMERGELSVRADKRSAMQCNVTIGGRRFNGTITCYHQRIDD